MRLEIVPYEPRFHDDCAALIAALPDWFGIPESNASYLRNLAALPSWVALADDRLAGAVTLEQHFPSSFEVHFMAVRPEHQMVGHTGFVSLGFGGRVTVDFGGCLTDRPGADVRVFQAVSSEPVSVYVSISSDGPFTLLAARQSCGNRLNSVQGYCDFDLADVGVRQARYVRVEDGELFACPGGSVSEGADLDAVQALGVAAAASEALGRP